MGMCKISLGQAKQIEDEVTKRIGSPFVLLDVIPNEKEYEVRGYIYRYGKQTSVSATVNSAFKIIYWELSDTVEIRNEMVGEIELDNVVSISDPCYDRNVWCRTTLKHMKTGNWFVYACLDTLNAWGKRCYILELFHESTRAFCEKQWIKYGEVGVDSGTMSVFNDGDYRRKNGSSEDFESDQNAKETFLEQCYQLADKYVGVFNVNGKAVGVVCSSGIGDGSYPLYVHLDEFAQYDAIKISFMEE